MLFSMSVGGWRRVDSGSSDGEGVTGITWLTSVSIPAGVTIRAREHMGRLTLAGRGPNAAASLVIDLATCERVSDVLGDVRERAALARLIEDLADDRARCDRQCQLPVQPLPAMDPSDVTTWSPMQILAAATAARWSLPADLGGTPEETRRINGAFLTVVWGFQ